MGNNCLLSILFLGVMCSFSGVSGAANPNLVGWWDFDDGAGTTAADSSGNGHDALVEGGSDAVWVEGQIGGGIEVGNGVYVTVPPEAWVPIDEEFTVAFWAFGYDGLGNNWTFFVDDAGGGNRVAGSHTPWGNGNVYFDTADSGGQWQGERIFQALDAGLATGVWNHWAFTKNTNTGDKHIYLNGERWLSGTGAVGTIPDITVFVIGATVGGANQYLGVIDDFQLYDIELTKEEIQSAMQGISLVQAGSPTPANDAVDVLRDEATMSWTAGEFAATHTVYFSTNVDDVNNGDAAVLAAEGLSETHYDPGRLEFGVKYFWRVDEVNAAPDNTVFAGEVWNYTVEPVSLPIAGVTAAATSSTAPQDPENTINGSGLNENDAHSDLVETMWLTDVGDAAPAIEFALAQVEKLDKVRVWNHNSQTESILGFGIKDALIETSLDGETWTELKAVVLPQATGKTDYTGAEVTLDEAVAQYVRLTPQSNYSILGLMQYGLSEVRFYAIPTRARELSPAEDATTDTANVMLSWRAGREAAQHEVYLGVDANNLDLAGTTAENTFVADMLDYSTTYFWQVVEVNETETPDRYESVMLSFNTPDYAVIDDMELYTAKEGLFIWEHWIDGFDNPDENGAVVGNGDEAEKDIVHGGAQSLPMQYNNGVAAVSEATLQIDNEDWLASGIQTLSLYFHGAAGNTGQLYLKINDTRIDYDGDASDLTQGPWRPWNIDLTTVGGDLSDVTSLAIGISENGATGKLYVDDIRLYPLPGETITPVEPDSASLLAHYAFEGDFSDSAGNHDGTALGDAKIVSDPDRGQVLSLDGDDDAVSVPLLPAGTEVTISMWVNALDAVTPSDMKSTYAGNGWTEGDIHWRIANNRIDGGVNGLPDGSNMTGSGVVPYEQWTLVVLTMSPTEFSYWLNGLHDVTRQLESAPTLQLGEGLIGAWMNGEAMEREWAGTIDDVRIYNRVLSPGELLWLAGKTESFHKPL